MPIARMTRARGRRQARTGPAEAAAPDPRTAGASLASCDVRHSNRSASSSAEGPSAPERSARISSKPASTKCSASWILPLPASRRPPLERGAPHDPGGPDVAVDAALVAEPVHQPRLAQQLVELRSMLLGHLRTDLGDPLVGVRRRRAACLDRGADRPDQDVRQLQRIAPADVEPVEQAVSDEVEVRGGCRSGVAVERAQSLEHLRGLAVRLQELPGGRIVRDGGDQPLELG